MATRSRTMTRLVARCAIAIGCGLPSVSASAQDRSVVFVHGLMGSAGTWRDAAARLQTGLALQPDVPVLPWRSTFETQAGELQSQLHERPADTVAVGHSNGGIVARQWSQAHGLSGIVTVGTPHRGAPLVTNLGAYAGFNYQLMSSIGAVYSSFAAGCCNWYFLLTNYHLYWSLAHDFADAALKEVATTVGIPLAAPVIGQMVTQSPYLARLNSPENLGREASTIPARIGIVAIAHNFYWGGPLRAGFPEYGDQLAYIRDVAIFGMYGAANYLYAVAPPEDFWARETANRLLGSGWFLATMDEWWCQAVSVPGFGQCWQNDTIVPVWSQAFPGGLSLMAGFDGPAHTQEAQMSDEVLHSVLNYYTGIPTRRQPPDPPHGSGAVAYEHVGFDGASLAAGGDLSFVGWEWNDRLSSIHVPSGRTVVLYEHADYGGLSLALTGDAVDLRDYPGPGLDGTWNDAVSSIEIR